MAERGIIYNCIRPKSERYNELFFLIIENPLKIQEIEQKIQDLYFPPIREYSADRGNVPETRWNYKLMHFDSDKKVEKWQINGLHKKVIQDSKLYPRKIGSVISHISKYIDKA